MNFMPFSVVYRMGTAMGYIDYLFSGGKRIARMENNLSKVFKDNRQEIKRIVINNLQNHCRDVLEFIKYPQLNQKNLPKLLSIEGVEVLDKELSKGKGVIIFTSHFGAKQLLQPGLGHRNYKINQIYYHMNHDELTFIQKNVAQRQRQKIEEKIPATFISADGFMRSAYKCLMRNEILIIAADGIGLPEHMNKGYSPFSFLEERVLFPSNTVSLAKRTGASIVPAFVTREGTRHKIIFEPALEVNSTSIENTFQKFVKILEKYILKYPSLWEFWEEFEEGNLIVPRL